MNREAILFHLQEAKEELDLTIAKMTGEPDYGFEEFQVAMGHLYHHLNTAWNGRAASSEQHRACSRQDFDAWRKFPSESEVLIF